MSHIIVIYQCKIIFVHRYISDISDFCYINKFIRLMIYQNFFMIFWWYISSMFDYFNNFKYHWYISDISSDILQEFIWWQIMHQTNISPPYFDISCLRYIMMYDTFGTSQKYHLRIFWKLYDGRYITLLYWSDWYHEYIRVIVDALKITEIYDISEMMYQAHTKKK